MDYMNLISRSFANAWRHKPLWVFGFFVCAAGGSNGISTRWDAEDLGWLHDLDIDFDPGFLALLLAAAIALGIVIWILSVLSEGALISGIHGAERGMEVRFGDCFAVGMAKFLRLFGIMFLATLTIFTCVFVLLVFVVPTYFLSVLVGILMTLVAIPALLAAILVVVCVEGWAIRYAVIGDVRWSDAIVGGWRLFRAHPGRSIGVAFSSLLSQIFIWCGVVIGLALLAVPFIVTAQSDVKSSLIAGGLAALAVLVVACAFTGTFSSSVWTLGFLRLTLPEPDRAAAEPTAR
jgi:hypothetical protein